MGNVCSRCVGKDKEKKYKARKERAHQPEQEDTGGVKVATNTGATLDTDITKPRDQNSSAHKTDIPITEPKVQPKPEPAVEPVRDRSRKKKHKKYDTDSDSTSSSSSDTSSSDSDQGYSTSNKKVYKNSHGGTTIVSNKTIVGGNYMSIGKNSKNVVVNISNNDRPPKKERQKRQTRPNPQPEGEVNFFESYITQDLQSRSRILPNYFIKEFGSTVPLLEVKALGEWSDSICKICYPGGGGTGFRVGPNYIMTARHVVDGIMSLGYQNVADRRQQSEFEPLGQGDVYAWFDFLSDGNPVNNDNIFYFEKKVHFLNENVDTAILELKKHLDLQRQFPKAFINFSIPKCNKSFYLIGHTMGEKKGMEKVEHIVDLNLEKTKTEIDVVQKWCRDTHKLEYDKYKMLTSPDRYLFHCQATKGASGSPGLVVLPDGRVIVVTMLLCGYPDWYYDPLVGQHIKDSIPKHWCVEQGASMESIYDLMKVGNLDLCKAIFGDFDDSIPARGPIRVASD